MSQWVSLLKALPKVVTLDKVVGSLILIRNEHKCLRKGLLARAVFIFDHAGDIDEDTTGALGIHGCYGYRSLVRALRYMCVCVCVIRYQR